MKHLLTLADLAKEELYDLLGLTDSLKKEVKRGVFMPYLRNKTLGMIFTKSPTRTRASLETGMTQLDDIVLYLSASDTQLGRGEPIKDTARMLSCYLDGIVIHTYKHSDVEELAEHGSIPIINGLVDYVHPCQVLADLQTIREHRNTFMGLKVCFIGTRNNMANSPINGEILAGMEMACAYPLEYLPDEEIMKHARASGRFTLTQNVPETMEDMDILVTDIWANIGEEQEAAQRRKVFEGIYQIGDAYMAVIEVNTMVLHCLPAHREGKITEKTFETHADEVFDEAKNRLHMQKAILVTLLEG